jgi:hypothetical protein
LCGAPVSGNSVKQDSAAPATQFGWVTGQAIGQNIQVTGVTGSSSQPLEQSFHPAGPASGKEVFKKFHGRQGSSRGNPKLVDVFVVFLRSFGRQRQIVCYNSQSLG